MTVLTGFRCDLRTQQAESRRGLMPRKYAYQRSWLNIQGLWSLPDATSQEAPSATASRPSTWGANLTHTQPKQQAGSGKRGDEGEEGAVRSLARKRGIFFSVSPEAAAFFSLHRKDPAREQVQF